MDIWQEKLVVILVGLLLLGWGQQLYWLLVGTAGFVAGLNAATTWAVHLSSLHQLLIGIAAGLLGIIAALVIRRIAFMAAGFIIGGYAALTLSSFFGLAGGMIPLLVFIVGGVVGMVLMSCIVDWALIGLSALAGALLISTSIVNDQSYFIWVVFGLCILGVIVQQERRQRRKVG